MNISQLDYTAVALACAQVLAAVLVLFLAKLIRGLLSPYSIDAEMTERDNPAFGFAIAGYYASTVIVYLGAGAGPGLPLDEGSAGVLRQLGVDIAWAVGGVLLLNASRWWMDRLLVSHVRNDLAIKDKQNVAAGLLEAASFISTALVIAAAIRQPGGGILSVLVFFVFAQFVLVGAGRLYQAWVGYRLADEIRSANPAAGTAFALTLIAIALLMMKAATGDFVSWTWNLGFFVFDAASGLLLLIGLRWLVDLLLLPHARFAEEIARDRNINAGLLEGVLAIGVAAIILFLF